MLPSNEYFLFIHILHTKDVVVFCVFSVRRCFSVGQCNSVFSISVVTASVNTNVGATSATSASALTGSVSTDAGVVSAIRVSIVNASVNADVPFSVVSILKLPIPNDILTRKSVRTHLC